MLMDFGACRSLFLPIDVQGRYLALLPKRSAAIIATQHRVADMLAPIGIDTAWVAFGKTKDLHGFFSNTIMRPDIAAGTVTEALLHRHSLSAIGIKKNQHVVVKLESSLFLDPWFDDVLQKKLGIDTVILAGGDTNCCVKDTARDAVKRGLKVGIIYDALYDARLEGPNKGNPSWHRQCLEKHLHEYARSIVYMNQKELKENAQKKPAPPQRKAPVFFSRMSCG